MIYLLFLIPILATALFPKRFPLYITIFISMYLFYGYLWIDEHFLYTGKAGWKGFGMFMWTMLTGLFYILIHYTFIVLGWREKNKSMINVHLAGLILFAIHVMAMFS